MTLWAKYLAAGLVGALIWETLRLSTMNAYDRADLIDQIEEGYSRSVGYEDHFSAFGGKRDSPSLEDRIDSDATKQFSKCGGRQLLSDVPRSYFLASYLIGTRSRDRIERFRLDLASMNSAFKLRAVQICRVFGQCHGKWPSFIQQPDQTYYQNLVRQSHMDPTGIRQVVLDYACGQGVRSSRLSPG